MSMDDETKCENKYERLTTAGWLSQFTMEA